METGTEAGIRSFVGEIEDFGETGLLGMRIAEFRQNEDDDEDPPSSDYGAARDNDSPPARQC
jgi:hypothetical protein